MASALLSTLPMQAAFIPSLQDIEQHLVAEMQPSDWLSVMVMSNTVPPGSGHYVYKCRKVAHAPEFSKPLRRKNASLSSDPISGPSIWSSRGCLTCLAMTKRSSTENSDDFFKSNSLIFHIDGHRWSLKVIEYQSNPLKSVYHHN